MKNIVDFKNVKQIGDTRKQNHYKAMVFCQNCGEQESCLVPKGTLVVEFCRLCKNCGCSNEQLNNYFREQDKIRR